MLVIQKVLNVSVKQNVSFSEKKKLKKKKECLPYQVANIFFIFDLKGKLREL